MTGHEGGMDIRRDDGSLDCSFNWIARNGEVHLTVTIDGAQYGLANVVVDLTSAEAHELSGGLKVAARLAGEGTAAAWVVPASVAEARASEKWTPWTVQMGHVLGERG